MPRVKKIRKRVVTLDPIYQNRLVTRLINRVMQNGKKSVAQKNVYRAFEQIKKQTGKEPLEVFQKAIENIKPLMEVKPRRVGGAAYQVPMPVRGDRRESLAIRWLIKAALARSSKEFPGFSQKLAAEIIAADQNEGGAIKRKVDVNRMAEANKAFAHFRW